MTDTTKYVDQALADLDLVKSEDALMGWHDQHMGTVEYAYELTPEQVMSLEDAYARKLSQFMPAGLAG